MLINRKNNCKLKEILYEIVGEINLEMLSSNTEITIPIEVSKHDIEFKFFNEIPLMKNFGAPDELFRISTSLN